MTKRHRRAVGRWLRGVRRVLRPAGVLLHYLSADERSVYGQDLVVVLCRILAERMHEFPGGPLKDAVAGWLKEVKRGGRPFEEIIRKVAEAAGEKANRRRNRKPGNTERDAAIVRLLDTEGLRYKKVGRRLRELDPRWTEAGRLRISPANLCGAEKPCRGVKDVTDRPGWQPATTAERRPHARPKPGRRGTCMVPAAHLQQE
jgi:hypothetical protein